jgi:hypothetical protein
MTGLHLKTMRGGKGSTSNCTIPLCSRSGAVRAEIMGWPCGRLCRTHAKEWQAAWDAAVEPPVGAEAA